MAQSQLNGRDHARAAVCSVVMHPVAGKASARAAANPKARLCQRSTLMDMAGLFQPISVFAAVTVIPDSPP